LKDSVALIRVVCDVVEEREVKMWLEQRYAAIWIEIHDTLV
jgi:hypothetical protein